MAAHTIFLSVLQNHVKFTEERVMFTEKHALIKDVYKWAKLLKNADVRE